MFDFVSLVVIGVVVMRPPAMPDQSQGSSDGSGAAQASLLSLEPVEEAVHSPARGRGARGALGIARRELLRALYSLIVTRAVHDTRRRSLGAVPVL